MARQFECTQAGCDFMVRANTDDEVVSVVRSHAQDKHGMSLGESDIRQAMEEV